MAVKASDIPDMPTLQAIGSRRSFRYYDPTKTVEDWKIDTMLNAARFASCQGNINCTEAVVVTKDSDLWDEIEECVSGFNVQIINQSSHLIFWFTNLNAWNGRAIDGLSTLALSGALTKYHGWNYEFSMTQTIPRLMSFPVERTDQLLRFETGQHVAQAMLAGQALGVGSILIAFGRKPGGIQKAFGLPAHYSFTWGHAVGYPLEDASAGGQRVRLKFESLFNNERMGNPRHMADGLEEALREKGLIQEQAPIPGRFEEIDRLSEQFGRDPGVISWPEKDIKRLMADDDWDFGPNIKARAQYVLDNEDLPEYPPEILETFRKIMTEHGIDTSKLLPDA